jgi:hypothetical protein
MSRSRRRNSAKRQQADRAAVKKFWGEVPAQDLPEVPAPDDPTAMVLSLGAPPLRTVERPAQEAFAKLYNRAAAMAFGLAVAADLHGDDDTDA